MERDPVCGMQVDPEKVRARLDHGGKTYFFCCPGCATKFQADPGKYLAPRPAAPPGGLIVLGGMGEAPTATATVLYPVQHASAPLASIHPAPVAAPTKTPAPASAGIKAGTKYTCPMDPEVISDRPGSCPICGMAL